MPIYIYDNTPLRVWKIFCFLINLSHLITRITQIKLFLKIKNKNPSPFTQASDWTRPDLVIVGRTRLLPSAKSGQRLARPGQRWPKLTRGQQIQPQPDLATPALFRSHAAARFGRTANFGGSVVRPSIARRQSELVVNAEGGKINFFYETINLSRPCNRTTLIDRGQ